MPIPLLLSFYVVSQLQNVPGLGTIGVEIKGLHILEA